MMDSSDECSNGQPTADDEADETTSDGRLQQVIITFHHL